MDAPPAVLAPALPNDAALDARLAALGPAERQQLERVLRGLPPTFQAWNARTSPAFTWDWPHLVYFQAQLDRVARREITHLIVEMPVRHGKSECGTVRFPVWQLVEDPATRVLVGAYNATLAAKFSRKARRLAAASGVALSQDRTAVEDWETTAGGGIRAVGVGGGATGHGAHLILIDDPVKSREEAESPTYRDKVWEWFRDDIYTRREPGAAVIVTMTRWHGDDLVGRLLQAEGDRWTVIRLPALAEENDALGRPVGAALCPARYDEAALAETRRFIGEYSFAALYQQSPRPREGNMFPRDRATIVPAAPAQARRVRYWDKGGSDASGDYTAGVRMAYADGILYVEHVVHVQLGADRRNALMRQTAEADGTEVAQIVEQEPGSGGKESAEASVKLLAGFPVGTEKVSGDKVTRADPYSAQWQAGNVRLVKGDWNKAYLDELEVFPNGTHDDQVDGSSGACNKLTLGREPRVRMLD